eukprot:6202012-Pleurochrysis_carterae.AAC.2
MLPGSTKRSKAFGTLDLHNHPVVSPCSWSPSMATQQNGHALESSARAPCPLRRVYPTLLN